MTAGPPNQFGEWVDVQGVASLALCEAAETTIQRPDLNFTKSPGPPCSPPLGQEQEIIHPCRKSSRDEGDRETGRLSSHQPSGTETPAMTCPRANIGGKRGTGRGRSLLSFPCHPLLDSCQAGATFPCVPDVSFAPLPSITPRASLPLGVVPHPRCRREGTHMSDAAAWYGWLRQRMECPQPWPMALHASAALPAPPPPRPILGAGWERRLPPRSARCCHRARCSAPRRAGGEDGAGATLIDGAAAAPRGWAEAEALGGGAEGAAPAARRRPPRAAPGLARAPRRAGEQLPLSGDWPRALPSAFSPRGLPSHPAPPALLGPQVGSPVCCCCPGGIGSAGPTGSLGY